MIRTLIAAVAVTFAVSAAQAADVSDYYVDGTVGSTFAAEDGRDNSTVFGVAVGREIGNNVRVDLGVGRNTSGDSTTLGEVEVDSVLGGVYYDLNTESAFTPFVGVNAGYAWADGTGVNSAEDNGIAYGFVAGVAYEINTNVDITTSYQYLQSNDIEVANQAGGNDNWDSQAIRVGLRYSF